MNLAVLVFIGFFLPNCSDDNATGSSGTGLVGVWELTKMTMVGSGFDVTVDPSDINFSLTLTINSNGTFTTTENDDGITRNTNGTWTTNGNKFIIVEDGETSEVNYTLSSNKLVVIFEEDDDGTIITITQEFTRK